jgi:hypothetical protein
MPDERIPKQVMKYGTKKYRSLGSPRRSWRLENETLH